MRNNVEIFFLQHSAKLTFSIAGKIIRRRDVSRVHCFFILETVEDSAAEVCRTCAGGPTAFETSQAVCLICETGSGAKIKPTHSMVCEVVEHVPEKCKRCFQLVAEIAVRAEMVVSDAAIGVPQSHAGCFTIMSSTEHGNTRHSQLRLERGRGKRSQALNTMTFDQVSIEIVPVVNEAQRVGAVFNLQSLEGATGFAAMLCVDEGVRRLR